MLVASVPVIHPNGKNLGTALVGMRRSYQEELVTRARQELVYFTAALLLVGAFLALILMSNLLRPVAALRQGLERIGRGDLDTPLQLKDRTELGLLADTVNGMAARLKATQAEMLEKERLSHEMDLAHQMQISLMPEAATEINGFVIDGSYQAAAEVGGDYYDVFTLPDGRIGVVIADVAGKGLAGCMVTSMLAVLMRSLREEYSSPAQLLVALEDLLKDSLEPGVFITIFYGLLDSTTGELIYASAGHSPLFLYRKENNSVKRLRTRGIPVGALRSGVLRSTLEDYRVSLFPGDMAVQYTDGINEAWNSESELEFGFGRTEQVILSCATKGARAVLRRLQEKVTTWCAPDPPQDDQTLLIISRESVPVRHKWVPKAISGVKVRNLKPREQLNEMLEDSFHLLIKADMEQLVTLRSWIESCPGLNSLCRYDKQLVENSLYEALANIIEHGYQGDASQEVDVWWLPACLEPKAFSQTRELLNSSDPPGVENKCLGYFIICDRGIGFAPVNWTPPDLEDPSVRRRGRGLGMHIIHSSMEKVVYIPDTPTGNLTLLRFDPHNKPVKGDVCNV
jgi:serine phosphatase RsbU (regulator of sigma subunit)/anti-sigma regulatory factor (Ser/Thr protein kinase)